MRVEVQDGDLPHRTRTTVSHPKNAAAVVVEHDGQKRGASLQENPGSISPETLRPPLPANLSLEILPSRQNDAASRPVSAFRLTEAHASR
jgi:hypothetical protein